MSFAALRQQGWVKISPMRVFAFNQIDFPVALPLLDLSFPDQRCLKAFMGFEPHEPVNPVFRGKAGDSSCLVLPNAAREFEGRTDVKSAMRLSGEKIDERHRADRIWFMPVQEPRIAFRVTPPRVRPTGRRRGTGSR